MNEWLKGFAYKTELGSIYFLVSAVIMIFILFLTTGIQTFRASRTNPVENLRDE
jgi:putative ABC transport system permease protein